MMADSERHGHWTVQLFICLMDIQAVVTRKEPHSHLMGAEDLMAIQSHIEDAALRVAGDQGSGGQIRATVQLIMGGDRETSEIGVIPGPDYFLHRASLYDAGRNWLSLPFGVYGDHLSGSCAERQGKPVIARGQVQHGWQLAPLDVLKVEGWKLTQLLESGGDGCHAETWIDGLGNGLALVRPALGQLVDEGTQILGHVDPPSLIWAHAASRRYCAGRAGAPVRDLMC